MSCAPGQAVFHSAMAILFGLQETGRYPQENVHAEIHERGQVSLEGCLSTTRALNLHFSTVP